MQHLKKRRKICTIPICAISIIIVVILLRVFQKSAFSNISNFNANVTVYAAVDDTTELVNALVTLTDENNINNSYSAVTNDSGKAVIPGVPVSVDGKPVINLPNGFSLEQNYPNPFNPETRFKYSIPTKGKVGVYIIDLKGDRTKTLVDMVLDRGNYETVWGGENDAGRDAADGIYFYFIGHDGKIISKKMTKLGDGTGISSNLRVGEPMFSRTLGKKAQASQDKTYKLEVSNTDSISHEISPYLMEGIPISQDTTLYALLEKLYKSVKGNAETNDREAVKNLGIKLVNNADTSLFYKTLTDTLGKFSIDSVLTNQGIYTLLAIPNDSTNPAVFPKEWNNIYAGDNLMLVLQKPRTLTGIITEFFSNEPDSGALVKTSIDSDVTNAKGEYFVLASVDREDVWVLKQGRHDRGFVVESGILDVIRNETITADDSLNGLSTWYLNYVLNNRLNCAPGSSIPPDNIFASLTKKSVPDTAWLLGYIENEDGYVLSVRLNNVAQLNEYARKINTTADTLTDVPFDSLPGLYNVDSTRIVIADSVFMHPDSIAKFQYPNMVAVHNNEFPVNEPEKYRKSLTFRFSNYILAANVTFYAADGLTIQGQMIIMHKDLPPGETGDKIGGVFNTEFLSSSVGGVETPDGYLSVLGPIGRYIYPQDYKLTPFFIARGPGHRYPDLDKGFSGGAGLGKRVSAITPRQDRMSIKFMPDVSEEKKQEIISQYEEIFDIVNVRR